MVQFLNLMHMKGKGAVVPPELKGRLDTDVLRKTQDYEREKTYFGFASSVFGNILVIVFIFGGPLNAYNSWIASLSLPFVLSGWLFFMLLFFAGEFLSVPFSIYETFNVENLFGFNTTTPKLWVMDFIKSLLISTVLMSAAIVAGLWLIRWVPDYWWLMVWGFLLLFSTFIMYISPYAIEPLFNKFTPVEDETLREKIVALAQKAGIRASRVLRVDASRRSRHTNAYFTGIGKTKRIILYDTLMEGMTHEEILAVLAHEIGHWKKRHLLKGMVLLEVLSLVALYCSSRLTQGDFLLSLFRVGQDTFFAKVILLVFLGGILSKLLGPLMNSLSRKNEREADRASYELTGDAGSMVQVFAKLSRENLANLYPHPLYVTLYYSHPPVLERIRAITEMGEISGRELR